MRTLDTAEYVSVLKDLTDKGSLVRMMISGFSMSPFLIHARDSVWFRKPDRALHIGDIVFYRRDSGQYVMHRICKIKKEGFYLIGDAQTEIEGPIREEQIFGLITKVERKGRILQPGNILWWFFSRIWIRIIPMRRVLIRLYSAVRGRR